MLIFTPTTLEADASTPLSMTGGAWLRYPGVAQASLPVPPPAGLQGLLAGNKNIV
ncbi:MAG: CRISPR-associated protein Cas5 [Dehalococcoidia bacterium]|nr:CRISPR-associated protein Cas5 [Dehalococcoidia bacterium]